MRCSQLFGSLIISLLCFTTSDVAGQSAGDEPSSNPPHPLIRVLDFAEEQHALIKRDVRDYECVIVKRERIDGIMQAHQFMQAKVRTASKDAPFAVYIRFLKPRDVAGREVQYIAGENDGKMLVRRRRGGITLRFDLDNPLVMEQSTIPITDLNFEKMLFDCVARLQADIKADPEGKNSKVEIFREATINKRKVTALKIIHAEKTDGLEFNQAIIYVDNQWKIPTRLEIYDWPEQPDGKPILIGEFTFLELKINPNFPDSTFRVLFAPPPDNQSN